MPTIKPPSTIAAGAIAGSITTIAAWAMREFAKVDLPAEVQGALTIAITAAVQWIVPRR